VKGRKYVTGLLWRFNEKAFSVSAGKQESGIKGQAGFKSNYI
jgi:hypothetical protein